MDKTLTDTRPLWMPSPNRSSRGGYAPRLIVIHFSAGITFAEQLGEWFADPSSSVSTHAGVDVTGRIVRRYVPSDLAAWSVQRFNRVALSVMLCTPPGSAYLTASEWHTRQPMIDAAARWIGGEARAAGIPLVKLSADQARRPGAWGVCEFADLIPGRTGAGTEFPWAYLLRRAGGEASHG
jgi:hypothetical protein